MLDDAERCVEVLDRHGVGRRAESGGDRGLVPVADGEKGGDRAQQTGDRVARGEEGGRAVLAVEAELECLCAGGQTGAVAFGGLSLLPNLRQTLVDVGKGRRGTFVLGVQPSFPRIEPRDARLQCGELPLSSLATRDRLLSGSGEPSDLILRGGRAGPERVHLAVQTRQTFAPVRCAPQQRGDSAVLLEVGTFGLLTGGEGSLEGGAVALNL